VELFRPLEITLDDERRVRVSFYADEHGTVITEEFEAEQQNPLELQQKGWQAILDNFRNYVETSCVLEILHMEITIHADPMKVYRTMLDKKGFADWTSEFNATSRYEGTWEKGARIRFLEQDVDGKTGG
jgi:uncharacterized protein YndB with AHSA1/START domain